MPYSSRKIILKLDLRKTTIRQNISSYVKDFGCSQKSQIVYFFFPSTTITYGKNTFFNFPPYYRNWKNIFESFFPLKILKKIFKRKNSRNSSTVLCGKCKKMCIYLGNRDTRKKNVHNFTTSKITLCRLIPFNIF